MQNIQKTQLYIQLTRHNEIQEGPVCLGKIAKLYGLGQEETNRLETIELMHIPKGSFGRYCLSAGDIADKILKQRPELSLQFLGDADVILEYAAPRGKAGIKDWIWTVFISGVIFVGSAFTIMTFIRESNLDHLFARIYVYLGMQNSEDMHSVEIGFAVGMGIGMLLYFNHFGRFRFQNEPTPMEMEMHQYMEDAEETVMETGNVKGEDA